MFKSREQRVHERILEIRKVMESKPKKVVKKVKPKKRVDTSAEKKRDELLDILNSKLKSSIKLDKVYKLLNKKSTTY